MSGAGEHEVVVLGGGPAGCAAATLLALCGHDVALVRPSTAAWAGLAESVPPSARRVLAELGIEEAVQPARLHPNGGNIVWWGDRAPRGQGAGQDTAMVDHRHTDLAESDLNATLDAELDKALATVFAAGLLEHDDGAPRRRPTRVASTLGVES